MRLDGNYRYLYASAWCEFGECHHSHRLDLILLCHLGDDRDPHRSRDILDHVSEAEAKARMISRSL
jgi:hypothetical protein